MVSIGVYLELLNRRIGHRFLYPGIGFGGSCFPQDVSALLKSGNGHNFNFSIIDAVLNVNNQQRIKLVDKVLDHFGDSEGKKFALGGLAFKPGTDDMREAPAIYVVKELVKRGAKVQAYDPKAIEEAQHFYLKDVAGISYFESKYEVLKEADALIMLTEWKEFRSPDFSEIKQQLSTPIIFDGRNQSNVFNLQDKGFEYHQIGKQN